MIKLENAYHEKVINKIASDLNETRLYNALTYSERVYLYLTTLQEKFNETEVFNYFTNTLKYIKK